MRRNPIPCSFLIPLLAMACTDKSGDTGENNALVNPADLDGDGFENERDCQPENAAINPMATDIVGDQIDQNCDGVDGTDADGDGIASQASGGMDCDDGDADPTRSGTRTFFADQDGDGFGNATQTIDACTQPLGYVADNTDCSDSSALVHPEAEEAVADGVDADCDGEELCYADLDEDGFGGQTTTSVQADANGGFDCAALSNVSDNQEDCDDDNDAIHPNAVEACDSIDNDCDGLIDDFDLIDDSAGTLYYADLDRDGYGDPLNTISSCIQPAGYVADNTDCSDSAALVHPNAEELVADGLDSNCDGVELCYVDLDDDGFGGQTTIIVQADANGVFDCMASANIADNQEDCDDQNDAVHPMAQEICDQQDNDCDALIDDADDSTDLSTGASFFADLDRDGYGDPDVAVQACAVQDEMAENGDDCNDLSSAANPLSTDIAGDGQDQNCDGVDGTDADRDGIASQASGGLDCDDTDSNISDSSDRDGDGYHCNIDCNDDDASIYPMAPEILNDQIDQNCDGVDADVSSPVDSVTPLLASFSYPDDDAMRSFCAQHNEIYGTLRIDMDLIISNSLANLSCLERVHEDLIIFVEDATSEVHLPKLHHIGGDLIILRPESSDEGYDTGEYGYAIEPSIEPSEDTDTCDECGVSQDLWVDWFNGGSAATDSGYLDTADTGGASTGIPAAGGANYAFPALKTVSGEISIRSFAEADFDGDSIFPVLESASGLRWTDRLGIENITGFSALSSLGEIYLNLYSSNIVSVSGFSSLEQVASIRSYDANLEMNALQTVDYLRIAGGDSYQFGGLTTAGELRLQSLNTDIDGDISFPALTTAEVIRSYGGQALSGFSNLSSLYELTAAQVSGFSSLTGLVSLRVSGDAVLDALENVDFLTIEGGDGWSFGSLDTIGERMRLEYVDAVDGDVSFPLLSTMGELSIGWGASTITGFSSVTELQSIAAFNAEELQELNAFPNITTLEGLAITGAFNLSDIAGFDNLTHIGLLILENNSGLLTLSGLEGLTGTEVLRIDGDDNLAMTSVDSLCNLITLETDLSQSYLSGVYVEDLEDYVSLSDLLYLCDIDQDGISGAEGDCDNQNAALNTDDADEDGYSTCDGDCDDQDVSFNPGIEDTVYDGIAYNCIDNDYDKDEDGELSNQYGGTDCDDTDAGLNTLDADRDGLSTCEGDSSEIVRLDFFRDDILARYDGYEECGAGGPDELYYSSEAIELVWTADESVPDSLTVEFTMGWRPCDDGYLFAQLNDDIVWVFYSYSNDTCACSATEEIFRFTISDLSETGFQSNMENVVRIFEGYGRPIGLVDNPNWNGAQARILYNYE